MTFINSLNKYLNNKLTSKRDLILLVLTEVFQLLRNIIFFFVLFLLIKKFSVHVPVSFVDFFKDVLNHENNIFTITLIFVLASLVGTPQSLLISLTVLSLGSKGIIFSYFATIISIIFSYLLGYILKVMFPNLWPKNFLPIIQNSIATYGLYASFIIRFIPIAPFIVVNMAFGYLKVKFINFIIGSACGIIPKIFVIGLLLNELDNFVAKDIDLNLYNLFIFFVLYFITFPVVNFLNNKRKAK